MIFLLLITLQGFDIFRWRGWDPSCKDGSCPGEGGRVWSTAWGVAAIRWAAGSILRGERFDGRCQSYQTAYHFSYGHWTRAQQVAMYVASYPQRSLLTRRTMNLPRNWPSEVMQRFQFNYRLRKKGEFVEAYLAKLIVPSCGTLQLRRYLRQDASGETCLGN